MARINQCAAAPAANDPRQIVKNVGVPVIAVAAQGEIIGGTYAARRADSDETNDRFRLYEVSSAGHIDKSAYFGFPQLADQTAAVGSAQGAVDWPFNAKCDPEIPVASGGSAGSAAGRAAPRTGRAEFRVGKGQPHFQSVQRGDGSRILGATGG